VSLPEDVIARYREEALRARDDPYARYRRAVLQGDEAEACEEGAEEVLAVLDRWACAAE
jgi:hypothetical protein